MTNRMRTALAFVVVVSAAAPSQVDAIADAVDLLAASEDGESFVRTSAYASGPAYGLLLDAVSLAGHDGWTLKVAPGWMIREGPLQGDYELIRRQP